MDEQSTRALVKYFEESAAALGGYHARGEADRDEFAIELARLEAIYGLLVEKHAERALTGLFSNNDLYVRLYAAKLSLLTNEQAACEVLQDLSTQPAPANLASNARRFLVHWQKGWLFPRRQS